MKRGVVVLLTGGVSGGHAMPTLSIFFSLRKDEGFKRHFGEPKFIYFGRKAGLEREVFENLVDKYFVVPSSKLRSYFSFFNIVDLLRLPFAFLTVLGEFIVLSRTVFRNNRVVLFSSGGYVSLPVIIVGFLFRIPIIIHEQTSRAGLANSIGSRFAKRVLISFEASRKFFQRKKVYFTGYPFLKKTRLQFSTPEKKGSSAELLSKTFSLNIPKDKKVLLVMGGSMGSAFLNNIVKEALPALEKDFFVFHQVGRNNLEDFHKLKSSSYFPVGFVSGEIWIDLIRKADVVISRAGAGSVSECIYLKKKVIFIPLKIARRDEQFHNALEAKKYIDCMIIKEDELKKDKNLSETIPRLVFNILRRHRGEKNFKQKKLWQIFIQRTDKAAISICNNVKEVLLETEKKSSRKEKERRPAATSVNPNRKRYQKRPRYNKNNPPRKNRFKKHSQAKDK